MITFLLLILFTVCAFRVYHTMNAEEGGIAMLLVFVIGLGGLLT